AEPYSPRGMLAPQRERDHADADRDRDGHTDRNVSDDGTYQRALSAALFFERLFERDRPWFRQNWLVAAILDLVSHTTLYRTRIGRSRSERDPGGVDGLGPAPSPRTETQKRIVRPGGQWPWPQPAGTAA